MNSFTSRPRSPIRPTTMTSAEVKRAIMPSSTDLPTPEPANSPRRWPRPTVSSALMARMPTSMVRRIGSRSSGLTRGWRPSASAWSRWAETVERPAGAIDHATEQRVAHRQVLGAVGRTTPAVPSLSVGVGRGGWFQRHDLRAGGEPTTSSVGIMNSLSPLKPTTSASQLLPPGTMMRQPEPSGSLRPAASITSPLMRVSRPDTSSGLQPSTRRRPSPRKSRHNAR
jgi:hypothetical protein